MKSWLANHSISAKTFISVWPFVVALWYFSPDFKDYVWGVYTALPHGIHALMAGVLIPALTLWNVRRKVTAEVEVPDGGSASITGKVTGPPVASVAFLLCTMLLMGATGCHPQANTMPPTAAQAAAIGIDDFAALASAAQDTEQALYAQGTIDKDTHAAIVAAFKRTGQSIQAVSRSARSATSGEATSIYIETLTSEVRTDLMNGVLGVKNADTRAKLVSLVTALGNAAAALTGGK